MPSLAVCRCLFRLMRHCFLVWWICLPVSEKFPLVWKCHLLCVRLLCSSVSHARDSYRIYVATRDLLFGFSLVLRMTTTMKIYTVKYKIFRILNSKSVLYLGKKKHTPTDIRDGAKLVRLNNTYLYGPSGVKTLPIWFHYVIHFYLVLFGYLNFTQRNADNSKTYHLIDRWDP